MYWNTNCLFSPLNVVVLNRWQCVVEMHQDFGQDKLWRTRIIHVELDIDVDEDV